MAKEKTPNIIKNDFEYDKKEELLFLMGKPNNLFVSVKKSTRSGSINLSDKINPTEKFIFSVGYNFI